VRANSSVSLLPTIAVEAEDLESLRVVILDKPLPNPGRIDCLAVDMAVVVDVVNRKKQNFCFSAAVASSPVVVESGFPVSVFGFHGLLTGFLAISVGVLIALLTLGSRFVAPNANSSLDFVFVSRLAVDPIQFLVSSAKRFPWDVLLSASRL
jgi:hypothetical protein